VGTGTVPDFCTVTRPSGFKYTKTIAGEKSLQQEVKLNPADHFMTQGVVV